MAIVVIRVLKYFLKMFPSHLIILHPVAFIEGGVVGYFFAVVEFAFGVGVLENLVSKLLVHSAPVNAV